ncbi:MAG TPA: cytochrome P450 [Polyangiaceae bacterium]|nr:cytochrome P450 [Polyangiaceae bacterium]
MSIQVDLFSPKADPYPMYALLREKTPVYRIEPHGYWAVSRYEDVLFVTKEHHLFSSETGIERMRPPHVSDELWSQLDILRTRNVVNSDPPDHTRLRRLVSGAFTPKAIADLEARVRQITEELIDAMLTKEQVDIVADFAIPLPVTVIAEMLGIDPARRLDFKRWSDDLLEIANVVRKRMDSSRIDAIVQSRKELVDHIEELIGERRRAPREDLISALVRSEAEEGKLTPQEVLSMVIILLIAGNETTTNLISSGTHLLLDHPEALAALRADPSLIPGFLEETLRFETPAPMLFRLTKAEVTLAGVTIPKDQFVMPLLAAANRDPAHFADPDRFDIRRDSRGHVAFGYGIHFCVGAPLSRLEGRVAFEALLRRLPAFSRVNAQPEWSFATSMRALGSLPVRFERPASEGADSAEPRGGRSPRLEAPEERDLSIQGV